MARAKETLPVASFPVSGNSPKYEEKIFLFTLPLKFISIFFKIYTCNVKIFHLCICISTDSSVRKLSNPVKVV